MPFGRYIQSGHSFKFGACVYWLVVTGSMQYVHILYSVLQ